MIDWEEDKPFIIGAVALIGVGSVLFLTNRGNGGTTSNYAGVSDPVYKNDTIFIPTNEYNIQYVAGDQTIENTDNRNYASDGGVINQPNIPKEPVTIPKPDTPTKDEVKTPVQTNPTPTPTPTPSTKPSSSVVEYTISKGDTLWGITEKLTGSATMDKVNQIAKDNNISNPNLIYANDKIKVEVPVKTPTQATVPKPTVTTTKTHTVAKGETLTSIAKKYGTTVNKIATANNIKNVNLIKVGQKLTIK